MTPRYYGEAKNLLMAALSSEYQHPKVAIAVDADVDIFNHSELLWALATRVNPGRGRGGHPGHAQPRDGCQPAGAGRAGHGALAAARLQDADRRHDPAAGRRGGPRAVRAHPPA